MFQYDSAHLDIFAQEENYKFRDLKKLHFNTG